MPILVKISRLADDPLCLRVSVGGNRKRGYYCLYRGTREQTIHALETVLAVMQYMPEQPIEKDSPEIRKS